MPSKKLVPVHPGAILRTEFLEPQELTPYRVAKDLDVPLPRINDIVLEKRGISAEMAVMLAHYFGTTDQFFINLQGDYDRRVAQAALSTKLARIRPRAKSPSAQ
ncbi:MAG: HigA family addiction module antitoxin [Steroidobacteraceae bacterium]